MILFSDSSRTIHRVPATGGAPSRVLPLDESRKEYGFAPEFLRDGRRFLYSSVARQIGVNLGSLDGTSRLWSAKTMSGLDSMISKGLADRSRDWLSRLVTRRYELT
jgi:hypothetical protein